MTGTWTGTERQGMRQRLEQIDKSTPDLAEPKESSIFLLLMRKGRDRDSDRDRETRKETKTRKETETGTDRYKYSRPC